MQSELLNQLNEIPNNADNLKWLVEDMRSGQGLVPFVGAGLSRPFGYPGWREFLLTEAAKIGIEEKIKQYLDAGEYEEAAEELLNAAGQRAFHDSISNTFGVEKLKTPERKTAVSLLLRLAAGPVITTNFDPVLETVFDQAGCPFERVIWGVQSDSAATAFRRNRRYLLKIHGDASERTGRVLTKREYEQQYVGHDGSRSPAPLPPVIIQALLGRIILFVGCSLDKDRTVAVVKEVADQVPSVPHYAIVERPESMDEYRERNKFLSDHNIRPIWYPKGQHEMIEVLLEYLIEQTPSFRRVDRKIPWNIPKSTGFFIGRDEILNEMHASLNQEESVASLGIWGLGGIGKTQTVLRYADVHSGNYEAGLWTGAENEAALVTGFVNIARELELPEWQNQDQNQVIAAVLHWLTSHNRWLLIFDNVDRPELLKPFLPQNVNGRILLTSRLNNVDLDVAWISKNIELREMKPGEAVNFLINRTARHNSDAEEKKAAEELAKELGYLPLALEQAGAYIRAKQASFSGYLESYRNYSLGVLEKQKPVTGNYPSSVAKTWAINFEEVKKVPAAADVMRLSAFLAPDAIPESLIINAANVISEQVSSALGDIQNHPLAIDELLEPIARYSLIHRELETTVFSMHRLVQEVLRTSMTEEEFHHWIERTVFALTAVFPFPQYDNWAKSALLLPHAQAVTERMRTNPVATDETILLLVYAADYAKQRARYKEAQRIIEVGLGLCNIQGGSVNKLRLINCLDILGQTQHMQDDFLGAEASFQQAIDICRHFASETQERMALSLNNLAALYITLHRLKEAETAAKEALEIRRAIFGLKLQTAVSMDTLAFIYRMQGNLAPALTLNEEALTILKENFPPDHPNVLRAQENCVDGYVKQGKISEAISLLKEVIDVYETKHGCVPGLAACYNNTAAIYSNQRDYEQASVYYQRALDCLKAIGMGDSLNFAQSLDNLGSGYVFRGDFENGLDKMRQAQGLFIKLLGPVNIYLARSKSNYGTSLLMHGDLEAAASALNESISLYDRATGEQCNDLEILGTLNVYFTVLSKLGLDDKAEIIRQRMVACEAQHGYGDEETHVP